MSASPQRPELCCRVSNSTARAATCVRCPERPRSSKLPRIRTSSKLLIPLRLEVKDKTFTKTGDIKIKCTATIHTIYWRSNEESIQGKSQQRDNGYFGYGTSRFWNSAAHPIVSASPTTIYSGTKILAVLLHFCWIMN